MSRVITAEIKNASRRDVAYRVQDRRCTLIRMTVLAVVCALVIISLAVIPAFAGSGSSREKLYTCVCIEDGDTLWSMAQEYTCPEYADSSRFIREVMTINHLTDESSIHAGAYLVIPYYADAE